MKRSDIRVAVATIGVFVSLGGVFAGIRGLLFDAESTVSYGAFSIAIEVATFVVALNPTSNGES
ncbi:DUF2964 family protein [Caballeronia humi]|uniref:DUF2964 domain-containing protein n=1 Tax=Caballeronia humi TaxID=326474 RepID=A0A158JIG7_9BURK|nr:DUF2964 family protein [Caballeronia humi]SAL68636.1 hypothetical protein AWB65_06736 [Caballeronia humi]